jgi:hypothetical protein
VTCLYVLFIDLYCILAFLNNFVYDAVVLDIFCRHCNWDPKKKVKKRGKRALDKKGGMLFIEEKNYNELKIFCPKIVTNDNLDKVLSKLQGRLKKIPKHTAEGSKEKVMNKEFEAYEEPLQTWIETFRKAAKRMLSRAPEADADDDDVVVIEENWLSIMQPCGEETKHGFFHFDIFAKDSFDILGDAEREYTAVHLRLPKTLGLQGGNMAMQNSLERLMINLIETTTSTTLAVKVKSLCLYLISAKLEYMIDLNI